MKLGIRAHDLGMKENFSQMAEAVKKEGFDSVQLVLQKSVDNALHEAGSLTSDYGREVGKAFEQQGIEIAMLGAYFNWFDDDQERGLKKYQEHLRFAADFGTSIVGTEVKGPSRNRWGSNPENQTAEAFEHVVDTAVKLVRTAEAHNALAGIEGACSHVLSTPGKVVELTEKIGSDHIALIFDLYNFLNLENYDKQKYIIDEALELYGEKLKIVHCKDFLYRGDWLEQVPLGEGLFDYPYLISRLYKKGFDHVTLIFEGITGSGVGTSKDYIDRMIREHCS